MSHKLDLQYLFSIISLVDTNSVYPEDRWSVIKLFRLFPTAERLPEIFCDGEQLSIDQNWACGVWISPLNDRMVSTRIERAQCSAKHRTHCG
jgi:hypothetical protein